MKINSITIARIVVQREFSSLNLICMCTVEVGGASIVVVVVVVHT